MRIFIMTDMEGSACVANHDEWCVPGAVHYALGCTYVTMEVNAAIAGFFENGATEVDVADGHGSGGLDTSILDPRASYIRFYPGRYPFGLTREHDGIAWIGQHAKAGTLDAHIAHTGSFNVVDFKINGISVGEFGKVAFAAQEMGVLPFFGAGDAAFCKEAEALYPGIVTAAVKQGYQTDAGERLTTDDYGQHNLCAKHLSPERARACIRDAAGRAAARLSRVLSGAEARRVPDVSAPCTLEIVTRTDVPGCHLARSTAPGDGGRDGLCALLNAPQWQGESLRFA